VGKTLLLERVYPVLQHAIHDKKPTLVSQPALTQSIPALLDLPIAARRKQQSNQLVVAIFSRVG
jgi:hypothetical protein